MRLFVGVDKDTPLDSKVRTYSIWNHDAKVGSVELAICTHSTGIGSLWIKSVNVGDSIYYMGPKGKLTVATGDTHIFLGDLSGLSHMYALKRE